MDWDGMIDGVVEAVAREAGKRDGATTVLLTGATGCGKTAALRHVAQRLRCGNDTDAGGGIHVVSFHAEEVSWDGRHDGCAVVERLVARVASHHATRDGGATRIVVTIDDVDAWPWWRQPHAGHAIDGEEVAAAAEAARLWLRWLRCGGGHDGPPMALVLTSGTPVDGLRPALAGRCHRVQELTDLTPSSAAIAILRHTAFGAIAASMLPSPLSPSRPDDGMMEEVTTALARHAVGYQWADVVAVSHQLCTTPGIATADGIRLVQQVMRAYIPIMVHQVRGNGGGLQVATRGTGAVHTIHRALATHLPGFVHFAPPCHVHGSDSTLTGAPTFSSIMAAVRQSRALQVGGEEVDERDAGGGRLHATPSIDVTALFHAALAHPVPWPAVAGCDEAKAVLQAWVAAATSPHVPAPGLHGGATPRAVLLYGPPGTGKTLLAKAVATALAGRFINVSLPLLMRSGVGESERILLHLFRIAAVAAPCVMFFDEMQAMFTPQTGADHDPAARMSAVLTTAFLACIDEVSSRAPHEPPILILAATNAPTALDVDLLRRFSHHLPIPPPDPTAVKALVYRYVSQWVSDGLLARASGGGDGDGDAMPSVDAVVNDMVAAIITATTPDGAVPSAAVVVAALKHAVAYAIMSGEGQTWRGGDVDIGATLVACILHHGWSFNTPTHHGG